VPSLGLSLLNADGAFASLTDETGEFYAYYITLPCIAAGFAFLGAALPKLLALPHHLFPFGHLFSLRAGGHGGLTDKTRLNCGYAIGMLVASFLVIMGSWLPYEFIVAFLGGDSIYAPIVGAAAPTVSVLLFMAIPFLACGKRSKIFYGTSGMATTLFKLLLVSVIVSVAPPTLAFTLRDFDYTWMSAAIAWVVLFLGAIVYYVQRGQHEEAREAEKTEGTHAGDMAARLLASKARSLSKAVTIGV
jgi:hypothetical protein